MNYPTGSRSLLLRCFFAAAVMLSCNALSAQNSPAEDAGKGNQWKDQATMLQVVQSEIIETNNTLAQPKLTDWALAMAEAYKSMLVYVQANTIGAKDMSVVLDNAYAKIKSEPVANPPMRIMVLDDMKAKQEELRLKLTFN